MFDDLRQQGDKPAFTDFEEEKPGRKGMRRLSSARRSHFLGMTPSQRFIISIMLLVMTCLLGSFCLLVTQRIAPSFLY